MSRYPTVGVLAYTFSKSTTTRQHSSSFHRSLFRHQASSNSGSGVQVLRHFNSETKLVRLSLVHSDRTEIPTNRYRDRYRFLSSTSPATTTLATRTNTNTKLKMNSDSDYGNDDFLLDFDPDAAIAKHRQQQQAEQQAPEQPKIKSEQQQQQQNSPFGIQSKFQMGSQTNPSIDYHHQGITPPTKKQKRHVTTNPSSPILPTKKNQTQMNNNPMTNITTTTTTTPTTTQQALEKTLQRYFGHKQYRPGQLEILQTLLQPPQQPSSSSNNTSITNNRDAAVFWSTGSGKSLCYQIPPLHTNKIAIVISPLISLMQDQVSKLNGLLSTTTSSSSSSSSFHKRSNGGDGDVAVFLGSAQTDVTKEMKALNGEYNIIYCTPEKLTGSGGDDSFLNALGRLHTSDGIDGDDGGKVCLIAVDESHCVSEWGHDFRPSYRNIGKKIRQHPTLQQIPILALTATAVPKVQRDILSSLHMSEDVHISQQSFDRTNLILSMKRKPSSGGFRSALKPFVHELQKASSTMSSSSSSLLRESTIIYCQTQNLVEEVSTWLSSQLESSSISVEPYHAGLPYEDRNRAHINFLTGHTTIIVATIAFGMGIDKPDTRRIIHYGPPKTVEEYYQQIGRAGRDGLEAYCTMFCNSADFDTFKTDFYLRGLSVEVKEAQMSSIDSLKEYAMSDDMCRRAGLLRFFGEEPTFGNYCGTCDVCTMRKLHPDDLERDFAESGARVVLYALSVLNGKQGVGSIEKILRGNKIEDYRLKSRAVNNMEFVKERIMTMKKNMPGLKKKMPVTYFTKDLLPALVNKGYVESRTFSNNLGPRSVTWSGYNLTPKGTSCLESGKIILPVPASVRDLEKKLKEDVEKSLADLKASGADIDQIPKKEIDDGEGEVFAALKTWYNYLDRLRRSEQMDRVDELDDLKSRIEAWRSDTAVRFRMAPADVMPEHTLVQVAYTAGSLKGGTVEKEALLSVGVRSGGIDDLVVTLAEWIQETNKQNIEEGASDVTESKMVFSNEIFTPAKAWEYAVYKPNKKTGLAAWESSYDRFVAGEHPQAISMSPANGKPIQVATVVGHILDGLALGRPVDLSRLAAVTTTPTKSQWESLQKAEAETDMDILGDPTCSGVGGEAFRVSDLLVPMMGKDFFEKDRTERTEAEKVEYSNWFDAVKWYLILNRVGYKPNFE